jgi:hypothetical protein
MDPETLVDQAAKQDIDLIAVTDHQSFGYVDGVIKAASGRLVVLPGMEITTQEGVHLLAIFPVDYPSDKQTKFLGFLELPGTGDTNQASRRNVEEVFKKVDEEGGLIIIPHAFANKTGLLDSARKISTKLEWLESGFVHLIQCPEDKIRYLDWDEHGHWVNRFVLASASVEQIETSTYSFAPINTSDCYEAENVSVGCTWFRMGEPSIDGLKQVACEPAARISKVQPQEENHPTILAVRVNGGYCDRQTFLFNSGLNCIVGPNHAGKSAAFDFIRFALSMDDTSGPDARAILFGRLNAILGSESLVELIFRRDGIYYLIKRTFRPEFVVQASESKIVRLKESGKWFRYDADSQILQPIDHVAFAIEVYEQGRIHRLRDDIPRQLEMLDEFANLQALGYEQADLVSKLNLSAAAIEPLIARRATLTLEIAELPESEDGTRRKRSFHAQRRRGAVVGSRDNYRVILSGSGGHHYSNLKPHRDANNRSRLGR